MKGRQMVKPIGVAKLGGDTRSLPSGIAAVLTTVGALLVSALALAPGADAHIYWTNTMGNIGRANLHGTGVDKRFISGAVTPVGIAVDSRHVYWADTNTDTIGRAKLNGKGVNRSFVSIPDPFSPYAVAVDAGHIYWPSGGTFIGRAKINGKRAQPKFIKTSPTGNTFGVAVDARHIFWTTPERDKTDTIGRAKLNGVGVKNSFISSRNSGPFGVAVKGRHIYWTNQVTNTIARANLDGTGAVQRKFITTGKGSPRGIAVEGRHIYWTNAITGRIGRANLDGTGVHRSFITTGGRPWGVAVDASRPAPPRGGLG